MKRIIVLGLICMLVNVLSCTDKNPKKAFRPEEAVSNATTHLNNESNYSWITETKEAAGSSGMFGTAVPVIEGKAEKNGVTWLSFSVIGLPVAVCMKGEKGAANALWGWQTFDETAENGGTPAAIVSYLRNYKTPVAESAILAGQVKEIKEANGAITCELKMDAVNEMLLLGTRQREGQEPPKTSDAKGSVTFWLNNGELTKFEVKVQGKVIAGDRESDINRTTTVEIKDVGKTKLELPAEAKLKLGLASPR